jgi:N-acetylglucosaminyldiphosphoundecaprenol N-acetyl-beta-D-mannosaminyltransferase
MTEIIIEKIFVANIPINLFTVDSIHETIKRVIEAGQKRIFLHANAHLVELAHTKETWIVDYFNQPDHYVMCDGSGIQLAAKITKQTIPEKIAYNVWVWRFIEFLSNHGFSIYLLGADHETIQKAAKNMKRRQPKLNLVGFHHGYFNKHPDSIETTDVIEEINRLNPDVLLVGFGMPVQERWLLENNARLHARAIFTCGGAFDFISGNNPVAPYFLRKLHLEWLFRFILEPIRLFSRATISNWRFLRIILKYS